MKKYSLNYYYDCEEKNIFDDLKDEVEYLINRPDGYGILGIKLPDTEEFDSEEEMFDDLKRQSCSVRYDAGSKLYYVDVILGAVEEMNEDDENEIDYVDYYYCVDGKIYRL